MAGYRVQGPICQIRNPCDIDGGTNPRVRTLPDGPLRGEPAPGDDPLAPPEGLAPEDMEIVKKVRRMRPLAEKLGFHEAVKALDHFLDRSGTFVEIPPTKVAQVRAESEAVHRQKLLEILKSSLGARTMLALQALVDAKGQAKPEDQWPQTATFVMDYRSGTETLGVSDDNLTYYGALIKSEATIECTRKLPTRCYEFRITNWRSWVVDNYDWDGDRQFGGDDAIFRWLLPTHRQMNRLTQIGYAKSYQRSSRSWTAESGQTWTECFDDAEQIEQDAQVRRLKIKLRQADETAEQQDGALPVPAPAEEMLGS